jgi:hypothetical protein
VRVGYGCDCDGASHKLATIALSPSMRVQRGAVQAHLGAVESIVGVRPETCPWRALYHPLVIEVVDVCVLAERGLAMARVDANAPAILLDAVVAYEAARTKAYAHHLEQRRKEDEVKRPK